MSWRGVKGWPLWRRYLLRFSAASTRGHNSPPKPGSVQTLEDRLWPRPPSVIQKPQNTTDEQTPRKISASMLQSTNIYIRCIRSKRRKQHFLRTVMSLTLVGGAPSPSGASSSSFISATYSLAAASRVSTAARRLHMYEQVERETERKKTPHMRLKTIAQQ